MFDARVLVDLGRAIGLFDMNSPEEAVLLESWFDSPGPWVNLQAALDQPANQELLVDGIEAILGDLDPREGDGTALLRVDPSLPFGFSLTADDSRLTLGLILDLEAEDGAQGYGLTGQVILPLVSYEAGAITALESLDLTAGVEITLASKEPFGRARADVSLRTDFGGADPDLLVITLEADDIEGLDDPLRAEFTIDLSGGSTEWEVLLLQLAAAGIQVLLGQLATGQNLPAAVQDAAKLVMDHLIPLLGWAPGDVPALGGSYKLPPLPIDAFFKDPEAALSTWISTLFEGPDSDESAQAALTHLGPILSFDDAGSVTQVPEGLAIAPPGESVWAIPLFVSEPGLTPRLLLWVGQVLPGARGLSIGVDLAAQGPDLIHPPGPTPSVSATPQLMLAAEVVAIPFRSGPVQALRRVEILGGLAPATGASYILNGVGGDPGDPILEHLGALRGGVRLVKGQSLEPVLEMLDLKVEVTVQGSSAIESHEWERVDLTKTDGLITLGAGLAVSTIGSALNTWLGNEAASIGVSIAHLLGLTASPGAPAGFPLTVTAGATPQESQLNKWLISDLPQAARQYLWSLLEGSGTPHFAHWLTEGLALVNALHGGSALTLSGSGSPTDPWRLPILPDVPGFAFSQNLALTFAVTQGATSDDRSLSIDLRMKAFAEPIPSSSANIASELVIEVADFDCGALPYITGQGASMSAATCTSDFMGGIRLDTTVDSGITLSSPSIPGFTAELGEAVARAKWARGDVPKAEILASAADLRINGQSFLNNPAGLSLVGGQAPDGWEDLNLRSPLLLSVLAADHVGGVESDATLTRVADALMGLSQLLGWTDDISTLNWPDPIPASGKIADVGALLGEGLPTFIAQRMADPGDHPNAVGAKATLELIQAMAIGEVFPHTQGASGSEVLVDGTGTAVDPFHGVVVKASGGDDLLGILAFYEGAPAAVPGTTLGLTAGFFDKESGGVRVRARCRSDIIHLPLSPGLGADVITALPMNLAYNARVEKDGGGSLFEDSGAGTIIGALRLGLSWQDAGGVAVDLTLEGVTYQGQARGDVPLDDPIAAPLLALLEQMPGSPFDPGHPARPLMVILGALGLVSLGAGGPSGFLGAPLSRFMADPGQYLSEQFIDAQTGALRLQPLVAALEGNPSAPGLLTILGLKRGAATDGPDLSVGADGTLLFTLWDDSNEWVRVGFNPLTRHFSHDVHYPPEGTGIFVAHTECGLGEGFKLWVDFDDDTIEKLLGSSRLSFAPLDKPVFWRFIAIVGAALGIAGGILAAFVFALKPWMEKSTNPLRDVFKALGLLNAQNKVPKIKDLIDVFGAIDKKIFANDTLVALDTALGSDWIYLGKALRTGLDHRPATAPDSSLFKIGTTDLVATAYNYGYLPLGSIGGFNLQIAAGGEMENDQLKDLGVDVDFGLRFNWANGGFGLRATFDPAGELTLDLDIEDANNQTTLPIFPTYDLNGLGGFLNLLSAGGQMLIALVLERTVKAFHDLSNPAARDLVAHLVGGLGIAKLTTSGDLEWNQTTGDIQVDQSKLGAIVRPGAGAWPGDFVAQMDSKWFTEALFDIFELCNLNMGSGNPSWTSWGASPPNDFKYLTWDVFPNAANLTLKVVAGNHQSPGNLYTDPQTPRGSTGAGLIFEVKALRGGDPCFTLGQEGDFLAWAFFDNNISKFKVDASLPLNLRLPLKHSGYLLTLGAEAGLTYGSGGELRLLGSARLLSGLDQNGAIAQGLTAQILPAFAGPDGLKVEGNVESDPGLSEAITTLAVTTVVELLLWQAETADDGKALLDLNIPFVNQTLGDLLASFADENQGALLQHNSPWSALGDVTKLKPKELLPQLLDSLASSITDPVKLEIVAEGGVKRYGVKLTQMDTIKVLPNASLVLGNEPGFGQDEPAGYYPLTLWLLSYNTSSKDLQFTPNFEVKDVGFKLHGKDGAPLVQGGQFSIGSVTLAGAGSSMPQASYGGAKVAVEDIGLPLGASEGNNGPAAKLLADDGSGPGFSISLSYNYASALEGFRVILEGADEDGILWFNVGKETGSGDVGRIGVLYDDSPTGMTPPVPIGLQEMGIFVEGSFGLGPLEFSVEGFGVRFALQDIVKPKNWTVELEGLGVHYETDTLFISGALRKYEPDLPELPGYAGAAILRTAGFELSAIGAYSQILDGAGDPKSSLFIFGMFSMDPGIGGPPFFFVKGLAGGFGYNRGLVVPEDLSLVPDHVLLQAMNSTKSAFDIIQDVQRDLPATLNAWWLAFGVKFTSFGVIKGDALLYLLLDQGVTIGVIGTAYFKQPAAKPVVNIGLALDAGFSTTGDDPRLWVKAQIIDDSWVLVPECTIYGGFALCAWFKRGDMVLTLGGYHPSFRKPDHYPVVPRVGLTFKPIENLTVKGECYFAITPREMMGGSRLEITYFKQNKNHPKKGAFAYFEAGFDAIIGWDPFYYDIHVYIGIYAALRNKKGNNIISLSARVELKLWGPPFGGWAKAQISIFSLEFYFGKGRGEVATNYITVAEFASKHLIPDAPPGDLISVGTDLYLLRDSARVSASKGLVPLEADKDGPASGAATEQRAIRVRPEFTLSVGFSTPATNITLARNDALGSASGDWWRASINEPGSSAERRVDLAPANKVDWTLPTLGVLRARLPGGGLGPVIPLVPGAQLEVIPQTGGFPIALWDKTATNASDDMVLDLFSGFDLRFLKSRPAPVSYTAMPEQNSPPAPIPLNPAGVGTSIFAQAYTEPTGGGGGGGSGGGGGDGIVVNPGDGQLDSVPIDEDALTMGRVAETRKTEVAMSTKKSSIAERFEAERAAAKARIAERRGRLAKRSVQKAAPGPLRFEAQSMSWSEPPEAPKAVATALKVEAPAPTKAPTTIKAPVSLQSSATIKAPKLVRPSAKALKGGASAKARFGRGRLPGPTITRAPSIIKTPAVIRPPTVKTPEVKEPIETSPVITTPEEEAIIKPTLIPGVSRGKSVSLGGRRPAMARRSLKPQGEALHGAGLSLKAGTQAVFALPGRRRILNGEASIALEGDQVTRVVALNRAGDVLFHQEVPPGSLKAPLIEGTHLLYLEGMGTPAAEVALPKAGLSKEAVAAPISSAMSRGGSVALGTGPGHHVYHIRGGTYAMRGGAFTVLMGEGMSFPEGRRHRSERVLAKVSSLKATLPGGGGTLIVRLQASWAGGAELEAVADGLDLNGSVPLGERRLMVVGAELYLMASVQSKGAFDITLSLPPGPRLSGLSFHPEAISELAQALIIGEALLPIEDGPLSAAGLTRVSLEATR